MDELQIGYKIGDLTLYKIKDDLGHKLYCFKCKCKKTICLYINELDKTSCGKCKENLFKTSKGRPEINTPLYKDWRKSVMARYGWKCYCCGSKKNIQAHHLDNWAAHPLLRYEKTNGVCLCSTKVGELNEFGKIGCHELFHQIHGKNYNTRGQFIIFAKKFFGKDFK